MAISHQQMEDWVKAQGYLKESDMADYLREQLFVTRSQLRGEGYASGDDVRQTVVQLVADEQLAFTAIRDEMQNLLDSTAETSTRFTDQTATATAEMAAKHSATLAELLARDAQLRDYVDTAQRNNQQAVELLSTQLASLANSAEAKLASVGDAKQAELEAKLAATLDTLRAQLASSADSL